MIPEPVRRSPRAMRSCWACLCILAGGSIMLVSACAAPLPLPQGQQSIIATYSTPTLSAVLPDQARPPAVIAAAEATLLARGYTIVRTSSTEERGEVVGRPPRADTTPTVTIAARRVAMGGTQTLITFSPFGDQGGSRSLLDGILQRLGL